MTLILWKAPVVDDADEAERLLQPYYDRSDDSAFEPSADIATVSTELLRRFPEAQGGPWPPHCVQGTPGAELHDTLDRAKVDVIVDAGYEPHLEGYSGFEETELADVLRRNDIDELTVVGLATDYCVRHTAADALRQGFRVTVDRAGIRGIDVEPGDSERALDELSAAGATIT